MGSRYAELGRRERQIMDVLFRRGRATAQDVLEDLPDPPSYSAVRGMLRLLETKGHVRHDWDGPRHVYLPTGSPADAQKSAARPREGRGPARRGGAPPRHVYLPTGSRADAQKSAARHVLTTFFNNSMETAGAAMLGVADKPLSKEELERLRS